MPHCHNRHQECGLPKQETAQVRQSITISQNALRIISNIQLIWRHQSLICTFVNRKSFQKATQIWNKCNRPKQVEIIKEVLGGKSLITPVVVRYLQCIFSFQYLTQTEFFGVPRANFPLTHNFGILRQKPSKSLQTIGKMVTKLSKILV